MVYAARILWHPDACNLRQECEVQEVLDRLDRIERMLQSSAAPIEYLDTEGASRFTGISAKQLENWRSERTGGPAYTKRGRSVFYAIVELRRFMEAKRVEPLL